MKASIEIINDSYNTYPEGEIIFEESGTTVYIKLSDYEREISVNKKELIKLLRILDD